jgi:hypothetical protein
MEEGNGENAPPNDLRLRSALWGGCFDKLNQAGFWSGAEKTRPVCVQRTGRSQKNARREASHQPALSLSKGPACTLLAGILPDKYAGGKLKPCLKSRAHAMQYDTNHTSYYS